MGEKTWDSIIDFTKKADQDLDEIYEYYEEKKEGLGKVFIENTFSKIHSVSEKPDKYSENSFGIRRTEVRGFSHYLYYIIKTPWIIIIAVWHTARKPFSIQDRIKEK